MYGEERLAQCLGSFGRLFLCHANEVTEIRIRKEKPMWLRLLNGSEIEGAVVSSDEMQLMISRLMEDSLYACEQELRYGYFTAAAGCRVGVCGKMNVYDHNVQSVANIHSLCIRIPRVIRGCAQQIMDYIQAKGLGSVLILSSPGRGKTTMLRDLIRQLSEEGYNVSVADERREIAACRDGIAQLDVGPRTDVMDGCLKTIALPMMLRSCAPDILAVDEIGGADEAASLMEAARSGVYVIATAHANGFSAAEERECIKRLLKEHIFRYLILLGPLPGRIQAIKDYMDGERLHAEGNIAVVDTGFLRGGGSYALQCAEKTF